MILNGKNDAKDTNGHFAPLKAFASNQLLWKPKVDQEHQ
jgi:hypothetical protein